MFRKCRRGLAIALAVAALALPAAPAVAAGQGEAGAPRIFRMTFGMELWSRLGQVGGWLRGVFLSDGSSFIDPDGLLAGPAGGDAADHTSYIDPNG